MTEPWLILIGGLLGSSHCIGMCGGFALTIGAGEHGWWTTLSRQMIYSVGRIATYAFLGSVAGFAGMRLVETVPAFVNAAAVLSVLAGVLLVAQGLLSAGFVPKRWKNVGGGCGLAGVLRTYLTSPGSLSVLLAGVATGFLPCGLVYAFLALAASTGRLEAGLITMTCFGLGTVPLMVATGCGGRLLSWPARKRVLELAAVCVVVTGCLTVSRGLGFLGSRSETAAADCPMCLDGDSPIEGTIATPPRRSPR